MIIAIDARPLVQARSAGPSSGGVNIFRAWVNEGESHVSEHAFHLIYSRPRDGSRFDDAMLKMLPENFFLHEISSYHMPSRYHMGTRVWNTLARTLGRIKADVYHAFTPLVPRTVICPVVPTIHDLSFELDPVVRRTAAGRELRRETLQSVEYADRLIAISSQTKSDIASIYAVSPERIDVIYNGIDPVFTPNTGMLTRAAVHRANDIRGSYLLAVGADIPRRNYSRMLAAMRLVWEGGSKSGCGCWRGGMTGRSRVFSPRQGRQGCWRRCVSWPRRRTRN